MFDVDQFIECVKESRSIWDKESKGYLDKEEKELCWMRIAQRMLPDWDEQKHGDLLKRVQDLKNKWRHIRDSYTKYLHQKNPKRKKYVYADNLSFLLGSVRQRASEPDPMSDDNSLLDGLTTNKRKYSNLKSTSFQTQSDQKLKNSPQSSTSSSQSTHKIKNSPKRYAGKLEENHEEDADKAFLLSVLPDLKKLNDDEKLDFRIHTLQFFRDLRHKKNFQSPSFETAICRSPLDLKPHETYQELSNCSPRTATPLSCPVSPSFSHHSDNSD